MKETRFKSLLFILTIIALLSACNKDDDPVIPKIEESELSSSDRQVISYFKEIALGFEFGNVSQITRKWKNDMKIFVGGEVENEALMNELDNIIAEINGLATDGFKMTVVNDSIASNYYLFLGSQEGYTNLYPDIANLIETNWGLFSLYWNSQNELTTGHMYVDTGRPNLIEQKHLLREELTQSIGLARDSKKYQNSIFQSNWTTTTQYASIDKELIRLLYHPKMKVGLNSLKVERVLTEIIHSEKE